MKFEKLDFKRTNCWFFVCKKCKQEVEEGDYTPHFETRREALEHLEDEGGQYYFEPTCACWNEEKTQ